jgi:hypothetical protein
MWTGLAWLRIGKMDLFPSSGVGRDTPILLRTLERVKLNH